MIATTWIKALHKGGSIASALGRSIDYIEDSKKTNNGDLLYGYECDQLTAQSEFLLAKRIYSQKTGRNQGKNDVIAYHMRMSFKHNEVRPEQALELGKELAMRWTRGKHQFVVAAHSNTKNPHVHVIYNSVNLEHNSKFQDFKRSAIALRKISDQICLENGLSIIENPSLSKGYNRTEYLRESKPPTVRDQLRDLIDFVIPTCKDFDSFLLALQAQGVEIKRGKQLSFKLPSAKRFIRHDTLGDDYSVVSIVEKISSKKVTPVRQKISESNLSQTAIQKPNLLIDIQTKIQHGYGTGFEQWAKIKNLKEMSKTLILLQERGLDNYNLLTDETATATQNLNNTSERINEIKTKQKEISELQKQIRTYIKTKDIFAEYSRLKTVKPSTILKFLNTQTPAEKFYVKNESEIILCKTAKKYFDEQGFGKTNNKKLPTIQTLQAEYSTLESEKKNLYSNYKGLKEEMISLKIAKQNVDMILREPQQKTKSHELETSL